MANKKYVPQGTYLACDKGTAPMEFMITNNNNSFLFAEPIANTGDKVPMVNVQPFGTCSITTSACVPAPIDWDGFEDGIFVGNFNPLLEDSVLPCGVGGKIEIFYSLEDAQAACAEEEGSFWSTLGKVVLVVAAVALIVVTGGAAIAAIGAVAAASGALATTVAVTVAALEVAGCLLTVKALYDYSQDGDEEALFKEVALGFLFLGAGKLIERGFRAWKAGKAADEVVEVFEEGLKGADEVVELLDDIPYDQLGKKAPCFLEGTLVKTPSGEKEIQKLAVGDMVLSYNYDEQLVEEKTILNIHDNWTNSYFEIRTANSKVKATSMHLFWVENDKKWRSSKELAIGMSLSNPNNTFEAILEITKTTCAEVKTYNFEVAQHHNYFVGKNGLLVHNQNKPSLFESTTKSNIEFYRVVDADGKTVYIGQTQQGVNTRFDQHIAEGSKKGNFKQGWGDPEKFNVEKVDIPKKGPLTPYEAHVWEKHLIEESKAAGNPLQNSANPIGETKYNKFKDLHTPC